MGRGTNNLGGGYIYSFYNWRLRHLVGRRLIDSCSPQVLHEGGSSLDTSGDRGS